MVSRIFCLVDVGTYSVYHNLKEKDPTPLGPRGGKSSCCNMEAGWAWGYTWAVGVVPGHCFSPSLHSPSSTSRVCAVSPLPSLRELALELHPASKWGCRFFPALRQSFWSKCTTVNMLFLSWGVGRLERIIWEIPHTSKHQISTIKSLGEAWELLVTYCVPKRHFRFYKIVFVFPIFFLSSPPSLFFSSVFLTSCPSVFCDPIIALFPAFPTSGTVEGDAAGPTVS